MTDAGIRQRTLQGTLQEGAQDKVREEQIPEQRLNGKPECSSGLPLLLHSGIPPGRL
ncbi:unnamed protein product, partial [Staurois parvus]